MKTAHPFDIRLESINRGFEKERQGFMRLLRLDREEIIDLRAKLAKAEAKLAQQEK